MDSINIPMDIADLELADTGERVVLVVAVLLAFNGLAYAVCHGLNSIDGNSGFFCILAFIACNAAAISIIVRISNY